MSGDMAGGIAEPDAGRTRATACGRAMMSGGRTGLILLVAALLLAGCGARESRVEAALVKAGVSPKMAACLAPRLTDRLTDEQLRTLAEATRRTTGKIGTAGVVAIVAGSGDPRIVDVVSSAGLHCALRS